MSEFICKKCGKDLKYEKVYKNHLNKDIPCDNRCIYCFKKFSRKGLYLHKDKCEKNPINAPKIVNNNVNTNNINASKNNNSNTLNNVNNTNVLLLSPYGLEHKMMEKEQTYREEVLGSTREKILDVVRQQKFTLAYQMLFDHIHGNRDRPGNHNIFIQDRERDEVCMFTGKQFSYQRADEEVPDLYRFLMCELKWMVGSADITFEEKDQLLHDIKCHWRLVNEETDQDIRRMLYNNKPIVEATMHNNIVKPDTGLIEDYCDFKRGTLKSYDIEVKLPE